MDPHPAQKNILESPKRFKHIRCGRRFGKTRLSIGHLFGEALTHPGTIYWYVAPTYRQAKMIAWDMVKKLLRDVVPEYLIESVNETDLSVRFTNNSKLELRGAENKDSLRGTQLGGVILDEYAMMSPSVWEEIIQPMLIDTKGWAWFTSTPKGYNHFYELEKKTIGFPEWGHFHYTSKDNPYLPQDEIVSLEGSMSRSSFEQEILAQYTRFEGLVYPEFDPTLHVVKEMPKDDPIVSTIAGVDWGYTNPSCILVIRQTMAGRFYVIRELYQTSMTTAELVEVAKNWRTEYKIMRFYCDSAEPDRIEEFKRAGINAFDSFKNIMEGISKVRELIKTQRLFILEGCQATISELLAYQYPESKEKKAEPEKPLPINDHAMSALRYAIATYQPTRTIHVPKQPSYVYAKKNIYTGR